MEATRKKKKKIWLVILITVVVIAVVAAIIWMRRLVGGLQTTVMAVEVEPVQTRDLSDYISLNGTVSGESRTNVVSEASAEVLSVSVQVGDEVHAGDDLVSLDTEELERQIAELEQQIVNADALAKNEASLRDKSLAEAREDQNTAVKRAASAVNEAQSQVNELQSQNQTLASQIENKRAEQAEAAALVSSLESQQELSEEQAQAYRQALAALERIGGELLELQQQKAECEMNLKSAESGLSGARDSYDEVVTSTNRAVSAAQNTVEMAKYQTDGTADLNSQLELLRQQLADCQLKAPCDGVVTAVNVSVGDRYGAGQTIITIEDTSVLKVAVEVKEADILKISEGMKAIIKTTATGDQEMTGTVTRVVRVKNQSVNQDPAYGSTGSTGYTAEITIDQADLLVGMSAAAKILLQEKKDILAVPYDLVWYDEDESSYVLVAEEASDGQAVAVRKNITLGEEIDYYIEVTGGDLKAGDLLIHGYSGMITEGSTFTPEQIYDEQKLDNTNDKAGMEENN